VQDFVRKKKVKFTIEQTMTAHRSSRDIALLFFNFDARWGVRGECYVPEVLAPVN
jgi:hypothetical protein